MDLAARFATLIEEGGHGQNPWDHKTAPILFVPEDF
jgi:hypothetical protein